MAPIIPKSFQDTPYARQRFLQIVTWAAQNHPFYREWLAGTSGEVPILTREVILENNDRLLNGHPVTGKTSGSTGVPVRISMDSQRRQLHWQCTRQLVQWLGGPYPRTRLINPGEEQAADLMDVCAPITEQMAFVERRHRDADAVAITTYPSNAALLSQYVLDHGLDMSWVKRFGCFAEVFEPSVENLIKKAFPNAQIWSSYSSVELGMIAPRCPFDPRFHHIMAGILGVEILDEKGLPCKQGEVGRIVITDYFNTTMPLIRYEIGDLAAPGTCECGKIQLPALQNLLGKVRGSLKHRDGRRIPFVTLSTTLRDLPGMRQYQLIQETSDHLTVRYAVTDDASPEQMEKAIAAVIQDYFGYPLVLTFSPEEHIDRDPSGKFYHTICKI